MGPRVFTVLEANALLPDVEALFAKIDRVRDRLKKTKSKLDVLEMIWGEEIHGDTNPDRREHHHYMGEIERLKKEFDGLTAKLVDHEVVLKNEETGVLDFYGVIDSRLVFLCWQRGEKSVEWYHHLEDGFSGRQRIPEELLTQG